MIRVEQVSKWFGTTRALSNVSFDIAQGETVAVAGAAGSGRSTLARVLATMQPPTGGSITIDGLDAVAQVYDARSRVFWVGQPSWTPDVPVGAYVALASAGRGRRPDSGQRDVLLAQVGVSKDAPLSTLAAPDRSLVDLVAAVTSGTSVVVIDVPFGSDGEAGRTAWLGLLRDARHGGATIVFTADAGTLVPQLYDRLLTLEAGMIVERPTVPARTPAV